jgi:hypothetical protein
MYGVKGPNVFNKIMPKVQGLEQEEEDIAAKLEATYAKMKQKAAATERRRKKGNAIWTPKVIGNVLVRSLTTSDAI